MTSPIRRAHHTKGMTLIETMIYVSLLSFLVSSIMSYSYTIQLHNIDLLHHIHDTEIN